jgi:hypothetical protein
MYILLYTRDILTNRRYEMKTNKPQLLEHVEETADSAKNALAVMFFVAMLALFGILVQIATHITVVTY